MAAPDYKTVLCAGVPGQPVSVVPSDVKGNCLVATKVVSKGAFVFGEAPLGSQQFGKNQCLVRACEHCHHFIGTLEQQLDKLCTVRLDHVQRSKLTAWEAKALERDYKRAFPSLKGFSCPMLDDSEIMPIIPCQWGCDAEYCSVKCRTDAERRYHALLCTGRPPRAGDPASSTAGGAASDGMDADGHGHSHGEDEDVENEQGLGADDENDADDDDDEEDMEHEHETGVDDSEVNAAALFLHQALSTNEVFLLAARLVGRVLETWVRNGNDMPGALTALASLHSAPWDSLFLLREKADRKKAELYGDDDGDGDEDDDDDEDEEAAAAALAVQVNDWLSDSLTILRALVKQRLPCIVESCGKSDSSRVALLDWEFDGLMALSTYSRLVGAFELNQLEMKIDSPVREYLQSIGGAAERGVEKAKDALAALTPVLVQIERAHAARKQLDAIVAASVNDEDAEQEAADEEAQEEAEDALGPLLVLPSPTGGSPLTVLPSRFPLCDGTVLYALICTMNHSCTPNVQVMYAEGSHVGAVVAQEEIAAGEELCINYIDTDQPLQARELDLMHYGFRCVCRRCVDEREETFAQGNAA